jgi:hypothetical protein
VQIEAFSCPPASHERYSVLRGIAPLQPSPEAAGGIPTGPEAFLGREEGLPIQMKLVRYGRKERST